MQDKILTPSEARKELQEAVLRNPGPWEQHSYAVAENARLIAEKVTGMDSDLAYVMWSCVKI